MSSVTGGGFASFSGTSMAVAPHVTGAWAVLKGRRPAGSVAGILAALRDTGQPIADGRSPGSPVFRRIRVDQAIVALTTTLVTLDTPGWNSRSLDVGGRRLGAGSVGRVRHRRGRGPRVGARGRRQPVFLGSAPYGGSRPDVGAAFGPPFTGSGFHLTATGLSPGGITSRPTPTAR